MLLAVSQVPGCITSEENVLIKPENLQLSSSPFGANKPGCTQTNHLEYAGLSGLHFLEPHEAPDSKLPK